MSRSRMLALVATITVLGVPVVHAQDMLEAAPGAGSMTASIAQATRMVPVVNILTGLVDAVHRDGTMAGDEMLRNPAPEPTTLTPVTDWNSGVFSGG